MKKDTININGEDLALITTGVAIVGSGAAALNAAVHLSQLGIQDILIITEKLGAGTSANTGSDKQTYYRLNPADTHSDSSRQMAEDLFSGHCMHGDIALVEAALSLREFYHLVEAGVPFPQNRFGEYIGFQTDHDSNFRGTSAGPRTSILMFQKLLDQVKQRDIPIMDETEIIELVTKKAADQEKVIGLLGLKKDKTVGDETPLLIKSDYVIFATGGPGALYADSVYPPSQIGTLGVALKSGVLAQNLGESQFGIASKGFRWNLSGSYQQVIPCYISTAEDGTDEREFLNQWFPDFQKLLQAQFLKGYQWPFDVRKLADWGSSVIDLLVYFETTIRRRRVFMDYRKNPLFKGTEFTPDQAPDPVRKYLANSGATGETPVKRLKQMNTPAFDLFRQNAIDLGDQPLEIAVCHQHCNGGLMGSIWWESNIRNFFPVGECNGSHGLYRPGGSALNSGQVGSLRAAQLISHRKSFETGLSVKEFVSSSTPFVTEKLAYMNSLHDAAEQVDPVQERNEIQQRMSSVLGIIRNPDAVEQALKQNGRMLKEHRKKGVDRKFRISFFLKNEDLLITERAFLESASCLLKRIKGGRGSFLIGAIADFLPAPGRTTFDGKSIPDESLNHMALEYRCDRAGRKLTRFREVRAIPEETYWFEKVWSDYREGKQYE